MNTRDVSLPDLRGVRIAIVNPYLEGRETDCARNLYPRGHLWGADALARAGATVEFVKVEAGWNWLGRINRMARGRLGDLAFDATVARRASQFDVIYVVTGSLLLTQMLRALGLVRAQVVCWRYVPPSEAPWWKLRELGVRWPFSRGIDAVACLTRLAYRAAEAHRPWAAARHVEWGTDAILFPGSAREGEYFFACGRTNRDYPTLLAAAERAGVPLVLLLSRAHLVGLRIPPNVRVIEGPPDAATDKGVPYSHLVDLYANARAVLICRRDVPGDTSGFTNLLEALAMNRPVAMTRTGGLDLDVEQEGVGRFIAPGDVAGWTDVMRKWSAGAEELPAMRRRARQIVEERWNHERHGRAIAWFIRDMIDGVIS